MNRILICTAVLLITAIQLPASLFEQTSGYDSKTAINQILLDHWRQKNIAPPKLASDAVFLRRAMLTAAGRLPTADEAKDFIFDEAPDKRRKLIDKLLDSPEYADMQAMRFADMLRIKSEFPINLWPNAVQFYHRTIRAELLADRSQKDIFYDLLTASGSNFRTAHANFFRASADRTPEGLAKMVLLTTMNMRETALDNEDFKKFAQLFSQIRYKSTYEWKEEIVYSNIEPCQIETLLPDGRKVVINTAKNDPRKVFADWLLNENNNYFERAMTNKVWYWVFGKGIYPEADNLPRFSTRWERFWGTCNDKNQPFCPKLQDYLNSEFKKSNYSLKHLYRLIMNSAAFHASSMDQSEKQLAEFAAYPVRRLESEVLIDALAGITGGYDRYMSVIPEPFTYLPGNTKAVNIADGSISSGVLDSFGRPPRDSGQFAERNKTSTDSQGLYLMNSTALYRRINGYCRRNGNNYR